MSQVFQRNVLIIFTFMAIIAISFQNCAENGTGNGTAGLSSSATLDHLIIDMEYNGGPGLFAGANVHLKSSFVGKDYFYQWFFQARSKTEGFPMDGANQPDLEMQNIELHQDGIYWLRVTDAEGRRHYSNKIDVNIEASQLRVQPSSTSSGLGGEARFVAEVRSGADVEYAWEWQRPGMSSFEMVPEDDPEIVGARKNVLILTNVTVAKHMAVYRLKITDAGFNGGSDRVYYSQQVHLTVVRSQPISKTNVAFDSHYSLQFDAVGIQRTSDESVALTTEADIKWQRWDRNHDKFVDVRNANQQLVVGKTLNVVASPRFLRYRAVLMTKFNTQKLSREASITYNTSYKEPRILIHKIEPWVRYNKLANGKYEIRYRSTVMRTHYSMDTNGEQGFDPSWRRWQRQRSDEASYVWIQEGDVYDNNAYREIHQDWNKGAGVVEHRPFVRDRFWTVFYGRSVGINNKENETVVTIRLSPGQETIIKPDYSVHRKSDGVVMNETAPVNIQWQSYDEGTEAWVAMTGSLEKHISMVEGSPNLRKFRVHFTNTNGNNGNIVTFHYLHIVKL